MAKYEAFSRRELRGLLRRWAWKNRTVIGFVGLGVLVLIVLSTVLFVVLGSPGAGAWYVLGAVHVALIAGFGVIVNSAFLVYEGHAIFSLRGEWGEQATRAELVTARNKNSVWGWVDSASLQNGDIDHLVVTREGGLVAIDSRWRTKSVLDDEVGMLRDAANAKLRAEQAFDTVVQAESAGDSADAKELSARAVVVLWGPEEHDLPKGLTLEGVDFISGQRLVEWLQKLDGDPVEREVAENIIQRVQEFRAEAWDSGRDE